MQGTAFGVVTHTGDDSYIGRIAKLADASHPVTSTQLEKEIKRCATHAGPGMHAIIYSNHSS
jgi:magnesium-transporting ATPase (P-type)